MSHTKGPWVVERSGSSGKLCKSKRERAFMLMVVAEQGGMPGLIVNQPPIVTPADEANARLIAAAPDLLEALKEIAAIDSLDAALDPSYALHIARAAIAKAEGK